MKCIVSISSVLTDVTISILQRKINNLISFEFLSKIKIFLKLILNPSFSNAEDIHNVAQILEPLRPCQFQMMIKQDRFGTMF